MSEISLDGLSVTDLRDLQARINHRIQSCSEEERKKADEENEQAKRAAIEEFGDTWRHCIECLELESQSLAARGRPVISISVPLEVSFEAEEISVAQRVDDRYCDETEMYPIVKVAKSSGLPDVFFNALNEQLEYAEFEMVEIEPLVQNHPIYLRYKQWFEDMGELADQFAQHGIKTSDL